MVKIDVAYEGQLHCRLTHGPSGSEIVTDAPKDNHGKGEAFSPTDLVAAALGSCMITVMGIFAERHRIDIKGTSAEVVKEMTQEAPRRIAKLAVTIKFPAGVSASDRASLERVALTCPVHKSLHPDVQIPINFSYPD